MNVSIFIVLLLFLTVGIIIWKRMQRKESFETFPPNSIAKLRDRTPVDEKLRQVATIIKGNDTTPIYVIDNFLSPNECLLLIESATGKMIPSPLTRPMDGDKYYRTSETGYFDGTGIQNKIDKRVYKLLDRPKWSAEKTQLQHYTKGKEFKLHNDAFHKDYDTEFWEQGQRTWTCMIYLNDVEEGGTTDFPNVKETLVPKKGRAVVWSSLKEDGSIDSNTDHQGSPVEKGEKWITTTWFRDSKQ